MEAPGETPAPEPVADGREKSRVEAFSDGVFAIAITLLILEIKVPRISHDRPPEALVRPLLELWPSFLAFVLSFLAILIMWINHHGLFRLVRRVSPAFLYANGFLLLLVSFVPFPTSVLAEYLDGKSLNAAATFYCGTFVLVSLGYHLVWQSMVRGDLFKPEVTAEHRRKIFRAYALGLVVYVASTGLAWVNGFVGLGLNLSLWVLWGFLGYKPPKAA